MERVSSSVQDAARERKDVKSLKKFFSHHLVEKECFCSEKNCEDSNASGSIEKFVLRRESTMVFEEKPWFLSLFNELV